MKLEKAQARVLVKMSEELIMKHLEVAGRVCYKSEEHIKTGSADKLISRLINSGHESVIEHIMVSAQIICDRSVSHQIVRHRLASYSQESQRYCNYSKDKFNGKVRIIVPTWLEDEIDLLQEFVEFGGSNRLSLPAEIWIKSMRNDIQCYEKLLKLGWKPEQARTVLPNSTKTELIMSMNLRSWRHFLELRTSPAADPQIRNVAMQLLSDFKSYLPTVFRDIPYGK